MSIDSDLVGRLDDIERAIYKQVDAIYEQTPVLVRIAEALEKLAGIQYVPRCDGRCTLASSSHSEDHAIGCAMNPRRV